jgi:hypothetical protein
MQGHLPKPAAAGICRRLSVARRTRPRQYNRAKDGARIMGIGHREADSIAADSDVELICWDF